jgi:hypothetical protein
MENHGKPMKTHGCQGKMQRSWNSISTRKTWTSATATAL